MIQYKCDLRYVYPLVKVCRFLNNLLVTVVCNTLSCFYVILVALLRPDPRLREYFFLSILTLFTLVSHL